MHARCIERRKCWSPFYLELIEYHMQERPHEICNLRFELIDDMSSTRINQLEKSDSVDA